jgi:hypothetical protein
VKVVCRREKGKKSDLKGIPTSGQYTLQFPGAASGFLPQAKKLEFLQSLKHHFKLRTSAGHKSVL